MSRDLEALIDIQESIELIFQYTQNIDLDTLERNTEKQDAVVRRLIIIGEATKRLSMEFRDRHSTIPWKQIAGMRDVITHNYDEIDIEEIWSVVRDDLPPLQRYIRSLL